MNCGFEFDDKDILYRKCIALLQDVKLTQGPQAVYSTCRRHKDFYSFVLTYQADEMKTLEGSISDLDK